MKIQQCNGITSRKNKNIVYTFSGFCSSLGGLLFTIYTLSGYGLHCNGMEMDAIAACVIGGILLTGGFGYTIGPYIWCANNRNYPKSNNVSMEH